MHPLTDVTDRLLFPYTDVNFCPHGNSWVSLCKCAVNLSGGQLQLIDIYTVLERESDRKLHVYLLRNPRPTHTVKI